MELSPKKVKLLFTAGAFGLAALACRNPIPAAPTDSIGHAIDLNNQIYYAQKTAEANRTPVSTYASEQNQIDFVNGQKTCAPVKVDGSIIQAITDANGGHFPTNQVFEYVFSVTQDGKVTIGPAPVNSTLQGGIHENDIVHQGNQVCIGINGEVLRTPFPSP